MRTVISYLLGSWRLLFRSLESIFVSIFSKNPRMAASSNSRTLMSYFLKIASTYQIIIWLISGGDYLLGIFDTIAPKKDYISLLSSICVISFSALIVCSNIFLLLNSKFVLSKNLRLNKWLNFAQIIHFSIFGLSYYMIVGEHIAGYYLYDKIQEFSYASSFYKLTIDASYSNSSIISVGLSLIPLILFLIFDNMIKENDASNVRQLFQSQFK